MTSNAFCIAKEALRLYPSTKTIYRRLGQAIDGTRQQVPVSVLHKLEDGVWRDDELEDQEHTAVNPKQFFPRRWMRPLSQLAQKAYIPFACGTSYCPARRDFGKRIVALLIATLADGLKDFTITSSRGFASLKHPDVLPSTREDFEQWKIIFPKTQPEH